VIKLYGMRYSNYYNLAKTILLEKGMRFEEVNVLPNQEQDFLAKSPMGKVPCLETDKGFITETSVIIEYLEELGEGPSFYPQDAFQRAKIRELIKHLELYIELPARRLYGDVFFNRPASEEEKQAVRLLLGRGFASLSRLASYGPYLGGKDITYADFFFRFTVGLATIVCKKALNWDIYGENADIRALMALINERESLQRVVADQKAAA
jgi:glutathione S-transferase